MSASDFDTLVTKVMTDDSFATSLAARPEQALRSAGIEPTADMLDALKGVDAASIKQLASNFNENRAAAS